jgi:hypothetical protein
MLIMICKIHTTKYLLIKNITVLSILINIQKKVKMIDVSSNILSIDLL